MGLTSIFAVLALAAGPDDFTLVMSVSPETEEGQRRLAIRALEICAGRYPQLERYQFRGLERLDPDGTRQAQFEVRQELTCSDTPAPASALAGEPAPADWQPSEQDMRDIATLTGRYLAAVDDGEADIAHGMWSEDQQAATPLDELRARIEDFRRQAGAPGATPATRLTWYVNPANAPRPGIYVAVDYERFYANLVMNCGYLVWYRESAGRYRLTRQEDSNVPRTSEAPTAEHLAQIRQMSRCPS